MVKYHKPSGLEQQKCIVSKFWRLKVQNQGVERVMLPLKPVESYSVICMCVCVCVCIKFFFFWLYHVACRISVLQPGIEPAPLTVTAGSPNP